MVVNLVFGRKIYNYIELVDKDDCVYLEGHTDRNDRTNKATQIKKQRYRQTFYTVNDLIAELSPYFGDVEVLISGDGKVSSLFNLYTDKDYLYMESTATVKGASNMNIKYGKSKRIVASESDGNYDKSFKAKGTTYYIEMLSGAGNYVAKWWDSSDNGLGYNNKGWVAIEGKNYRALNNISDVSSDIIIDLLSVISDYDRKPSKPIQDRIKREVAKLLDFDAINSSCGKKSVKASTYKSIEITFISPNLETGRLVVDKAREIGGFGSTWNEHSWVYIDVPSTQSVDNVDDLIEYAQSVGVYLNRPSAKLLDAWADSKAQTVLRGCTEKSVKASAIMSAADISNLTIYVPSYCYVDVMVDSYEQGEGEQVNSWTFQVDDAYSSGQALINSIADASGIFSDNIDDYVVLDSSLQTDVTVNAYNEIPTEEELEAWKRGELELYVAHLWVRLQVGSATHDITDEEAEAFGLSIY